MGAAQGVSSNGKIAKLEPFECGSENIDDILLWELYLNFEEDAAYFSADDMLKVCFALSYMKAKFTAQWARCIMGELEAGTCIYEDWDTTQLLTACDTNKKEETQWRLQWLKQGTSCRVFCVKFEEHKSLAGYNGKGYQIYALNTIPSTHCYNNNRHILSHLNILTKINRT